MFFLKQPLSDLPVPPFSQKRELSLQSTLLELPPYDYTMESSCLEIEVAKAFEINPLLAGVILTEQGQFLGMISRRRFLEHMSRPYGLELFLKRPIKNLHLLTNTEPLVFSANTLIIIVVCQLLQPQSEELYEPNYCLICIIYL